ncbi:MAG: hypothetical protein NUW37_07655 [Planctomycetes bacterium]|nr:hypothetical protein [Planctomycetota bacterium]
MEKRRAKKPAEAICEACETPLDKTGECPECGEMILEEEPTSKMAEERRVTTGLPILAIAACIIGIAGVGTGIFAMLAVNTNTSQIESLRSDSQTSRVTLEEKILQTTSEKTSDLTERITSLSEELNEMVEETRLGLSASQDATVAALERTDSATLETLNVLRGDLESLRETLLETKEALSTQMESLSQQNANEIGNVAVRASEIDTDLQNLRAQLEQTQSGLQNLTSQTVAWDQEAEGALIRLIENHDVGTIIAKKIANIGHPSGTFIEMASFSTSTSRGVVTLVVVSRWRGGMIGGTYETGIAWQFDKEGTVNYRVTVETASFGIGVEGNAAIRTYLSDIIYSAILSEKEGTFDPSEFEGDETQESESSRHAGEQGNATVWNDGMCVACLGNMMGRSDLKRVYNGIEYHFCNDDEIPLFESDPEAMIERYNESQE